jgi:hypothetical protein
MTQKHKDLYGPSFPGDYEYNDSIVFMENEVAMEGIVIQCCAAMTLPSGKHLGVHYIVDCGDGFPHVVRVSQIVGEESK